jgi:hypothetical protein
MAFMMFPDCKASGQLGRFIGLFLLMNVMLQPFNVFPEMLQFKLDNPILNYFVYLAVKVVSVLNC